MGKMGLVEYPICSETVKPLEDLSWNYAVTAVLILTSVMLKPVASHINEGMAPNQVSLLSNTQENFCLLDNCAAQCTTGC